MNLKLYIIGKAALGQDVVGQALVGQMKLDKLRVRKFEGGHVSVGQDVVG
jgi:hypothetical protein